MTKVIQRLKDWFSLDTRALAVARMGLGLAIVCDLVTRLSDLEWHYTDLGLIPRSLFMSEVGFPWSFSLYFANGSIWYAGFLLTLHIGAAVGMALGWRTRSMTALNAILMISLHNRNWFINNGGDDVIRALLVLSILLPWGEIWSVDQWRRADGARSPRRVSGAWVLCWFLQVFCIYFMSYILKTSPIWRSEFSAIYYSSHLNIFTTWFGRWLRPFPGLLKLLTAYAITAEWLGPVLLTTGVLLPKVAWRWVRGFTVLLFWGLHLGIIFTMNIGLFPYYCLFMWLAFLPSEAFDWLEARVPAFEAQLRRGFAWLSGPPVVGRECWWDRSGARVFAQCLGVFFFLNLFFWNLSTFRPLRVQFAFWMAAGRWTHIYQEWNMFAPFPKQEDVWIEVPAVFEDGSTRELISGDSDLSSSKRERFPDFVRNEHWRKLYLNLAENEKLSRYYAGAWCRLWNRPESAGGKVPKLTSLEVVVNQHLIVPNYVATPKQSRTVWKHWCFEKDLPGQLQSKTWSVDP